MSFYEIGQSIKSVLDTVKNASGSRLQSVFDYDSPDADTGYPYATLTPKEAVEEILDTAYNQTTYKFIVRVVDMNKNKVTMEQTMRKVSDDILAELRKQSHQTFGGTVDRVNPFVVSWGWDTSSQLPLRFCEIEIEVLKDFQI